MKRFIEKYIDSFGKKDAMDIIDKKIDKARELCCEGDEDYVKELAVAYEMIEDYFQVIGYTPKPLVKPVL